MHYENFRERPLLFVDLEMSGLDPTVHEILEVGALVVDPKTFKVQKEYEAKVKPEHIETADKNALRINGYNPHEWKRAKPMKRVLNELGKLAPGAMIVGWNVALDFAFLHVAYLKHKIKPSYDYHALDVLSLTWKQVLPEVEVKEIKLSELCRHFGIKRTEKHRALADIKATYEVFMKVVAPQGN